MDMRLPSCWRIWLIRVRETECNTPQLVAFYMRAVSVIPNDERGAQVAFLLRGGCALSPDAYLFMVIDRAIQAELSRLSKRQ